MNKDTNKIMARPGFSFCICPDAGLIKAQAATQCAAYPVTRAEQWEHHTFWGDAELPQHFWETLTLQGFMNTPRVLILRQAHSLPTATWKRLSVALGTPNETVWLFACLEVPWEKGQPKIPAHITKLPCFIVAGQKNWVWRSPGLDERSLKRHAQERAKALGLRFGEGALNAFVALVPPESVAVETELAKLALAAQDGLILSSMCSAGGYVPEHNIFAFIRHVQAGNLVSAWREIHRDQKDSMLFPLLGLLMREARLLWQVLAGEDVRLHPQEAHSRKALAARLGYAGLARLVDSIVRAEWYIKSGRRSPEQTLEALTVDMARLFAPEQRP